MGINIKILCLLLLTIPNVVWAGDLFQGQEEVEVDPEVANNPLIGDFLNLDETASSRKPKRKWERFKSLEEQGINYVPSLEHTQKQKEAQVPNVPTDYNSDPFANRLDYLEEKLGVNKQNSPY